MLNKVQIHSIIHSSGNYPPKLNICMMPSAFTRVLSARHARLSTMCNPLCEDLPGPAQQITKLINYQWSSESKESLQDGLNEKPGIVFSDSTGARKRTRPKTGLLRHTTIVAVNIH